MFDKIINFEINSENSEVVDFPMEKTAAETPDNFKYDPNFLYIKVRAIMAGEMYGCNKNGDYFSEEELKKSYKTFMNAHVFKNHENKKVENAIGDVLSAEWDDEMKCVILFIRIDRTVAPTIVAGFEKGYITDVSMGCRVSHTVCSICQRKAKTPAQYCEHIKYHKHEVYPDGRKVFEINYNPKFHDISAVLNGADRTAKLVQIVKPSGQVNNVSNTNSNRMDKVASQTASVEFEKVASEIVNEYQNHTNMQECLQDNCDYDPFIPFEKTAKTVGDKMSKVAEIKKRIQGNVEKVINDENQLREEKINTINTGLGLQRKLLPEEKIDSIANSIKQFADEFYIPVPKMFAMFLKISAINGVMFSPTELINIIRRVKGLEHEEIISHKEDCPFDMSRTPIEQRLPEARPSLGGLLRVISAGEALRPDLSAMKPGVGRIVIMKLANTIEDAPLDMGVSGKIVRLADELSQDMMKMALEGVSGLEKIANVVGTAVDTATGVSKPVTQQDLDSNPILKGMYESDAAARGGTLENIGKNNIPNPKVSNNIPQSIFKGKHTNRKTPTIKTFQKTALEDIKAYSQPDNNAYEEINKIAYACYVDNIENYINSKNYTSDLFLLDKVAMDKEAIDLMKYPRAVSTAATMGAMGAMYGQYQNQRARRGEDMSKTNRTIAENPGTAAGVAAGAGLYYGAKYKKLKKLKDHVAKTGIKNILKKANCIEAGDFESQSDIDIFKNEEIDNEMREAYTDDQINVIKLACIMHNIDQDKSNYLLEKNALSKDDIDEFLTISAFYV